MGTGQLIAVSLLVAGCSASVDGMPSTTSDADAANIKTPPKPEEDGATGQSLSVLTYNVAGLPPSIAKEDPAVNNPKIGPLLNNYDVALVQEDFAYDEELRAGVSLPHQSEHLGAGTLLDLGDGLNRFSKLSFRDHTRQRWEDCSGTVGKGSDCLTPKGFTWAVHELPGGTELVIVNLHMDAGRKGADKSARQKQLQQLLDVLDREFSDEAILVAGDTNLKQDDAEVLEEFLTRSGWSDACRSLDCPEPHLHDRIMLRSSSRVTLRALTWKTDASFVDEAGKPLSDHPAVAVVVGWDTVRL